MLSRRVTGYWVALGAFLALVAGYVHWRDLPGRHRQYLQSGETVRGLSREADRLKQETEELRRRVEYLGSDPVELEAAIRRSENLVREGETIYRIEGIDGSNDPPTRKDAF